MKMRLALVLTAAFIALDGERAIGQQPPPVPRVGVLIAGSMSSPEGIKYREAFIRGFRELGYVDGQNIAIEYRSAERQAERLPELADELVRLGVTVIVASGVTSTQAAIKATKTVPIVMVTGGDPVKRGFVKSLSRPGGSVTGMSSNAEGGEAKRMELLKETVPRLSRVAILNPDKGSPRRAQQYQQAAKSLGIEVQSVAAYNAEAFEPAFEKIAAIRPDGFVIVRHGLSLRFAQQIGRFALEQKLPSMAEEPNFVSSGALMSYGRSVPAMWRRATAFVDKILKGADPATLPVEPPPQFELVVNLQTAQKIGVTIPPEILLEAAEVIK